MKIGQALYGQQSQGEQTTGEEKKDDTVDADYKEKSEGDKK